MREVPMLFNTDWVNPCSTVYDEVVRKDNFRPDSETIKDFNASGMSSGSGKGVFDFDDGKNHSFDEVSSELIALRENKLDKAEIEIVKQSLKNKANSEVKSNSDKEAFDKAEKVAKARNEAIDSILGVSSPED